MTTIHITPAIWDLDVLRNACAGEWADGRVWLRAQHNLPGPDFVYMAVPLPLDNTDVTHGAEVWDVTNPRVPLRVARGLSHVGEPSIGGALPLFVERLSSLFNCITDQIGLRLEEAENIAAPNPCSRCQGTGEVDCSSCEGGGRGQLPSLLPLIAAAPQSGAVAATC